MSSGQQYNNAELGDCRPIDLCKVRMQSANKNTGVLTMYLAGLVLSEDNSFPLYPFRLKSISASKK